MTTTFTRITNFISTSSSDRIVPRLTELQQEVTKIDLEVKRLIGNIELFEGADIQLNQMCCQVREKIGDAEQRVQDMKDLVELLSQSCNEAREFATAVRTYKQELVKNVVRLRSAMRRCLENRKVRERDALFTCSSFATDGDGLRQRQGTRTGRDEHVTETKKLNKGLESLLVQVNAEVKKSEEALQTLLCSSEMLSDTNTEFKTMDVHVKKSGKLLTKYQRRDLTDRVLFCLSFIMFFAVVLYIIRKRFLSIFW